MKSAQWLGRLVLMAAACLVLLATMRGTYGALQNNRWAVVVGLNSYFHDEVTPLRFAVNDSRAVRRVLVESCGFPSRNVLLLNTEDWGRDASTKVNIEASFKGLAGKVGPNDTVLFFFSGHGVEMDGESYLLTFEANPRSVETLVASCLKVADLRKWLRDMKCSRVLFLADACRNDPRGRHGAIRPGPEVHPGGKQAQAWGYQFPLACPWPGALDGPGTGGLEVAYDSVLTESLAKELILEGVTPGSGSPTPRPGSDPPGSGGDPGIQGGGGSRFAASFLSCDIGQRSFEWVEHRMGFFSYFLCAGLQGEAKDETGRVTLRSLEQFVRARVPRSVQEKLSSQQNPRLFLQGSDQVGAWALSTPDTRRTMAGTAALALQPESESVRPRGPGARLTCAVDIIGNNVSGRSYNQLKHRIEEHFYEVDKAELRARLSSLLNDTGQIQVIDDEKKADVWVHLNVCPTQRMEVALLLRDRETTRILVRASEERNRPYPGDRKQLVDVALKIVRDKMLGKIEAGLKATYGL